MTKTKHSLIRCRQRGISIEGLELVRCLGTKTRRPGGAYEYYMTRKDGQKGIQVLKQCIQSIERLVGKAIVIDEDEDCIITAYHRDQRRHNG